MIRNLVIALGGREHELAVERLAEGRYRIERRGVSTIWDARRLGSTWSMLPAGGGAAREIDLDVVGNAGEQLVTSGELAGISLRVVDPLRRAAERAAAARPAGPAEVKSPMPGKVVRALVAVGSTVTAGQPVVVVEAMKMENELKAPRDGTVSELRAKDGQAILAGETLLVLT